MLKFINSLNEILDFKQKRKFSILIFLIILNGVVEAVSIGSFLPLLYFLFDPNNFKNFSFFEYVPLFKSYLESSEIITQSKILNICLIVILIVFSLKFLFAIAFNYFLQKTIWNFNYDLSNLLFSKYINTDFDIIKDTSSAKIIRNINNSISDVVSGVLSISMVISEIFILICISFFLILLSFKVSMTLLVFFLILLFVYYNAVKLKVFSWGEQKQIYGKQRIEKMQEIRNFFREVKIYEISTQIIDRFKKINFLYKTANQNYNFSLSFPKYFFEFVIVLIGLSTLFFFQNLIYSSSYLPLLSIFTIAILRLLPSINRISVLSQSSIFSRAPLIEVKSEIDRVKKTNPINLIDELNFNNQIILKNISFKYKNIEILQNINLEIKKNKFVVIQGQSGKGKTTLLNLILGFLKPVTGEILCDEININKNLYLWFKKLSIVSQETFLISENLEENLSLNKKYKSERLKNILKDFELDYLKLEDQGNRLDNLSGGEKQRINISRAFLNDSEIIILDEPTSSLDINSELKIKDILIKLKGRKTIILVSHKDIFNDMADEIFLLNNKTINKKIQNV